MCPRSKRRDNNPIEKSPRAPFSDGKKRRASGKCGRSSFCVHFDPKSRESQLLLFAFLR
jgi:hypothetical protein